MDGPKRDVHLDDATVAEGMAKLAYLKELSDNNTTFYTLLHEGRGGSDPPPPLSATDANVLLALYARHPVAVGQYDIEAMTQLTRKTVSDSLRYLRKEHLAHRPRGDHSGDALTERGLAVAAKLPKDSP